MSRSIEARAREVVTHLGRTLRGAPSEAQFAEAAETLRALARAREWESSRYREAAAAEELVYELAVSTGDGPALYLVSDGASVRSDPHRHDTWAIIVGIRGCEVNHLHVRQPGSRNTVVRTAEVEVGPFGVLVLGEQDIHSTAVRDPGPTYHLHLYGRALHALPAYADRCYALAAQAPP